MSEPRIVVESFPVGPLSCNCSIVCDRQTGDAIVIDPGGDFERIRERLEALGAKVAAIVHTHTHIDHVGATEPLARLAGITPQIHEADRFLYDMLPIQAALIGGPAPARCEVRGDLLDGRAVSAGSLELAVLHTPGHTPGSVCLLLRGQSDQPVCFTGDTLFRGSIGRTDLWGGDTDAILTSLRERLLTLDDDTRVIAGHGDASTIEQERRLNPFLRR
jgi:glyoxylase-like metal-dependent hydrolase (beta-lactamase superfamily II)